MRIAYFECLLLGRAWTSQKFHPYPKRVPLNESCAYLIEELEDVVDEDVGDDDFGGNNEAEAHSLQVPRVSP